MKSRKTTISTKPARKTRTKTRKHKYISLRRKLPQVNLPDSGEITQNHNQLNLFPLHPENLIEDREDIQGDHVACFFDVDGGATLNGLLWGVGGGLVSSQEDSLSPSLTYAYGGHDSEEGPSSLERTALRHKERDASEDKWVCYSEVVEKKEEEVTSCFADYRNHNQTQGLSLKLDYEEIMNAWSDRGPLYIDGEYPQIVPDIIDDAALGQDSTNELVEVGSVVNVPLMRVLENSNRAMDGVDGVEGGWKMEEREARVLRYKEKRQSRLFAKRIRYEVRKLNAEKRPRMKGRFVRRS